MSSVAEPTVDTSVTEAAPVVAAEMWDRKSYFPKNRYVLRLKDKKFGPNSKNNPMITFEWEIISANSKVIQPNVRVKQEDGSFKSMCCIGLSVTSWQTLTEASAKHVKEFHKLMGIPVMDINPEAPDLSIYDGLVVNAVVSCDKTAELSDDIDETTGQRKPILDDNDKPIIKYRLNMGDIISRNVVLVTSPTY